MTTDILLQNLRELGVEPYLADDGTPRLRNAAGKLTPELAEALKACRNDIIRLLTPKVPRRIVLLPGDDRHAEPESVLCEPSADGVLRALREQAAAHPGRLVAAEWLWRRDGRERWFRYSWMGKESPDA